MTRPSIVPLLFGFLLALPVAACASTPSVDETAAEAGVSSAQSDGSGDSSSSDVDPGGNPGGPGGDADTGGGGGGGGGGNPGAPGDVAVFEEAGVPHSVLREDAATRCADGVCTLLEPVPTGDPDDVGGLDECIIQKQSDIHYDPPAHDGVFQEGATVQAQVDCTTDGSEESTETPDESGTTDESGSTETTDDSDGSESTDSGTTDSGMTDEAPADEPQG